MYKRVGSYYIKNDCICHASDIDNKAELMKDQMSLQVYEVIRIFDKKPVFLEDHLERLKISMKRINHKNDVLNQDDEIEKIIQSIVLGIDNLIQKEALVNHNIRVEIHIHESVEVYIFPVATVYPTLALYDTGVAVKSYVYSRHNPHVKQMNRQYVDLMIKLKEEYNVFEIVLKDSKGKIFEGSKSSIMFIKEGVFISPKSEDILKGITRKNVIAFIESEGYKVFEEDVFLEDIPSMEGAFLMGTSLNILPIKQFDNVVFNLDKESLVYDISRKFHKYFFTK